MKTFHVELGDRAYPIVIGTGILPQIGPQIRDALAPSRVALIGDATVDGLYGESVAKSLEAAGLAPVRIPFPAGERSKSLEQLAELWDRLIEARLDRKALIVALGGGVTGDLAGFAAASYMRGIRFVQIPTTLLAQVDSSSGGKTGINRPAGKNLIGAFHQPSLVWIDVAVLRTLPREELLSGLAEVIKHGAIRDEAYFRLVAESLPQLLACDTEILEEVVLGSVRIKGEVVAADEREGGVRALLNLGHTFGHAYESLSAYRIRHGEAVAIGMMNACRLAEILGVASAATTGALRTVLERAGLPTRCAEFAPEAILKTMYGDKKTEHNKLRLILCHRIGHAERHTLPDDRLVLQAIAES